MIKANDPTLESWLQVPENSDFPIQNIPFGIGCGEPESFFVATRSGNHVVNLAELHRLGYLEDLGLDAQMLTASVLNPLLSLGKLGVRVS